MGSLFRKLFELGHTFSNLEFMSMKTYPMASKTNITKENGGLFIDSDSSYGISEPKFCCFKAENYILFFYILDLCINFLYAGRLLFGNSDSSPSSSLELLESTVLVAIYGLGLYGINRQNFLTFTIPTVLSTILEIRDTALSLPEKVLSLYDDQSKEDAFLPDPEAVLVMAFFLYLLFKIFCWIVPVIKYASYLRKKQLRHQNDIV